MNRCCVTVMAITLVASPARADPLDGLCIIPSDAEPTDDPDCVPGSCSANGVCETGCRFNDPDCPARNIGAPCDVGADCDGGICNGDSASRRYCSASCASTSDCPDELRCLGAGDAGLICQYSSSPPGAEFGDCATAADCLSGLCVKAPGDALPYCTTFCSDDCLGQCLDTTGELQICTRRDSCGVLYAIPLACCSISMRNGASIPVAILALALLIALGLRRRLLR